MDLLGGYGTSSDDEGMQPSSSNTPKEVQQETQPMSTLPSAAALLAGDAAAAARTATAAPHGLPATSSPGMTGQKRDAPDVRGPLPNPLAPGSKVQRSSASGTTAAGAGRGQLLLPPQLRGRANVATEDLSNMFTRSTLQKQQKQQKQRCGDKS